MIKTYSQEIRKGIIEDYFYFNCVALLINKSNLGYSNAPTTTELNNRKSLIIAQAAATEVVVGNGYKRALITVPTTTEDLNSDSSSVEITVNFTATGGSIGPFSHVVIVRGANLSGATLANGNNRGSAVGKVICVEPVLNAPFTLLTGQTFNYTFNLSLSSAL